MVKGKKLIAAYSRIGMFLGLQKTTQALIKWSYPLICSKCLT